MLQLLPSVVDPWHLVRIRIRGSVPLIYGSGSCFCRQWLTRCQQKISFFASYFLKVCTFTSVFKEKKSKRSHNVMEIKVFPYLFCLLMEGSGSLQKLTNPDPGGPKTSGSTTLLFTLFLKKILILFLCPFFFLLVEPLVATWGTLPQLSRWRKEQLISPSSVSQYVPYYYFLVPTSIL